MDEDKGRPANYSRLEFGISAKVESGQPLVLRRRTTDPAVYLWLAHATGSDAGEVLYVGKAGKGGEALGSATRRLYQQRNGAQERRRAQR